MLLNTSSFLEIPQGAFKLHVCLHVLHAGGFWRLLLLHLRLLLLRLRRPVLSLSLSVVGVGPPRCALRPLGVVVLDGHVGLWTEKYLCGSAQQAVKAVGDVPPWGAKESPGEASKRRVRRVFSVVWQGSSCLWEEKHGSADYQSRSNDAHALHPSLLVSPAERGEGTGIWEDTFSVIGREEGATTSFRTHIAKEARVSMVCHRLPRRAPSCGCVGGKGEGGRL